MGNSRIEDNPSFKKLAEGVHNLQQLNTILPILKPFLRLFGVKIDPMEAALAQVGALGKQVRELITLPDRFNDLFASRGWIMYDLMSLSVAKVAIAKAEEGDFDGAEQILVDYYDEEALRIHLIWMNNIKAFRPRIRFAQRAMEDYLAARYYARIPILLMQLDGLVNDLSPKVNNNGRRGFFAEGSNLEAWDTIAGHSSGLPKLAQTLRTNRTKTREEQNSIPDRHGILHGNDLGYDNQVVAAKAWAALFAAREWALKVERGQVTEPVPEPNPGWRELFQQFAENAGDQKRLDAWKPRSIQLGEAAAYGEGTPEQKLTAFLAYWHARNYGYMADCLPYSPQRLERGRGEVARQMREYYGAKRLKSFALLELEDHAPAMTIIKTRLMLEESGAEREQIMDFHLIYEDTKGHGVARGKPGCAWVILDYPVTNIVNDKGSMPGRHLRYTFLL